MADADEPDRRAAQRLPQREVVHPRKAEAELDAAVLEQVDDQLRAGRHRPILTRSRPGWPGDYHLVVSFIGKSRRVIALPVALPAREEPAREPAKTQEPVARQ